MTGPGQVLQLQVGQAAVAQGVVLFRGQLEQAIGAACSAVPFAGLGIDAMQVAQHAHQDRARRRRVEDLRQHLVVGHLPAQV
ncbi:hypothetical protein G6F46_014938 [Rhizopus delemar]|nr:hypothetical protein G6F46_014938 [Rhizopus delemar]